MPGQIYQPWTALQLFYSPVVPPHGHLTPYIFERQQISPILTARHLFLAYRYVYSNTRHPRFPSTVVGKLSDFSGFYRLEIISLSITSPQLPLSPRKFNVRSTCAPIDRGESPGEGGRLACKQLQGELSLSPTLPEFVYLLK